MNTNYKFTTRRKESPNSAWQYMHCMPQNYVPYPQYQPCYGYPATAQPQYPYNPYPTPPVAPQQPMTINGSFLTNEDESFFIDLSPVLIKLNAFSCELTDKHICSIDFNSVKIESSTSRYHHYGPLTATAYINKDGSIDFILWYPHAGDDEEEDPIYSYNLILLYKRTFTAEEIKSVGDHCMEKLLCAFMNEALQQEQKNK